MFNQTGRLRPRNRRPWSARNLLIAALAVSLFATMLGVVRFYSQTTSRDNEIELREAMQRLYHEMESALLLRMNAVDGLSAHLSVSLPLSNPAEFDQYAKAVLNHTPQIRALEFADANGIIRYVYPIAGNESAVGLNLRGQPSTLHIVRSRRFHETTVSAPVATAHGALSIVIRSPIFDSKRYLGTARAVCDLSGLFDPLSRALGPRFGAALENSGGVTMRGVPSFPYSTVKRTIMLGGTHWTLVVGWLSHEPRPSLLIVTVIWIVGLAFIGNLILWVTRTRTRIVDLSESVEQKSADLAATQLRYRTLVETADDMIVHLGLDGSVMYANGAYRERRRNDSGSEPNIESSTNVDDEDERNITTAVPSVVEHGKHSIQYSVAVAKGETAYRYARLNLIRNEEGRPDSILAIIRDITEQRRLEEETAKLQEEFHQVQRLEAIGLLAAAVAHDFNNVITVITGNAELIRLQHADNGHTCSQVDTILDAGSRAAELASQLLSHSRRQIKPPEVMSLNNLLAESVIFLNRLLGENVAVRLDLEPNLWSVRGVATRMEQVVMNLAVNARDAMPDGGTLTFETSNTFLCETLEDRFGRLAPGEYARLTAKDTGSGMDPEVQCHLFEPFFSTKGSERGTGLGLATVLGIIKQCGGHISVASERGKGTAFTILLPRVDSEPSEPKIQLEAPTDESAGGTILVAEDDEDIRRLAVTVLRERGYRVLEATDGKHALQVADQHHGPIDLLLTDLVMPRMSGKILADRMRTSSPSLKVVFISGYGGEGMAPSNTSTNGAVLLQKPFKLSALTAAVGEALAVSC